MRRLRHCFCVWSPPCLSAYNCQSARIALLLGSQHDAFWQIVMDTLRARVPPEKFGPTEEKIAGFANGYATVLYFDDTAVTEEFERRFLRYRENFPAVGGADERHAAVCRLDSI